jgi:hypothetical protein
MSNAPLGRPTNLRHFHERLLRKADAADRPRVARSLANRAAACRAIAAKPNSKAACRPSSNSGQTHRVEPREVLADDWDQALADAADRMAFD